MGKTRRLILRGDGWVGRSKGDGHAIWLGCEAGQDHSVVIRWVRCGDRVCLLTAKGMANAYDMFESVTGDATSPQMLNELVGDDDFKFKL